jgi:hypothetical protein
MEKADTSAALPEEILGSELEVIKARRRCVYHSSDTAQLENPGAGLRGLSLSGGGIRSSTFSLGVIQAMATENLFRDFDYLSTVSGGGYTGSLLSSILNSSAQKPETFPLRMPVGTQESPALQHLRNGSNYLTPGGFLQKSRLLTVIVRGLLLNLLLLLPFIMLAVILTELWHEFVPALNIFETIYHTGPLARYVIYAVLALVIYFTFSGHRFNSATWNRRNGYELSIAVLFLICLGLVAFAAIHHIVEWAIQESWSDFRDRLANQIRLITIFTGGALLLIGLAIIKSSRHIATLAGKVGIVILGALGPAFIFAVYLLLVIAQVDSPFITFTDKLNGGVYPPVRQTHELSVTPAQHQLFALKNIDYTVDPLTNLSQVQSVYCGDDHWLLQRPQQQRAPLDPAHCGHDRSEAELHGILQLRPQRVLGASNNQAPLFTHYDDGRPAAQIYEIFGQALHFGRTAGASSWLNDYVFIAITFVLFLLNYFFINVNQSSLHSFYRDRLSKLYLLRGDKADQVEHYDSLCLSELNQPGSYGPYHIINSTLNLHGSGIESLRGRDADFFFFSRNYCGSAHTGYCQTQQLEVADKHLNLGTAMAISAAAAAPNMGTSTIRSLVFVLTLLNVRLGYWLPNPRFVRTGMRIGKPWALYLWREATGDLTPAKALVNVSDGGHIENLAIYEMLRRRCKIIVCIDGEQDGGYQFRGLINLMRLARIDLGVEINIDLNDLKPDPSGLCRQHFAIGRITYGGDMGDGQLIYVKSSMTVACEGNPFLASYRANNPEFPHQSTGDQFFDEQQFEAYRALGEYVGKQLVTFLRSSGSAWPCAKLQSNVPEKISGQSAGQVS